MDDKLLIGILIVAIVGIVIPFLSILGGPTKDSEKRGTYAKGRDFGSVIVIIITVVGIIYVCIFALTGAGS
jgi:formate-dependent nitrite reductase membrane component NrfD